MTISVLSVISLILGILGMCLSCIVIGVIPCILSLILGGIALLNEDAKKFPSILGMICSAVGIAMFAVVISQSDEYKKANVATPTEIVQNYTNSDDKGKNASDTENSNPIIDSKNDSQTRNDKSQNDNTAPISTPMPTRSPIQKDEVVSAENVGGNIQVDVIAEYTLPDGIGWWTRHFIILKNNSGKTVDISTSSLAYDINGNMVGADDSELYAIGAGCTSILYDAFETDATISYYDTNINAKESRYYDSVIQDLSYMQNNVDNGAIFQVTNNGTEPADFVEGYALFFKNGNLVSYESAYFTDGDSELKPGETISKQLTSYVDFDSIQFYLTGRK